MSAITEATVLGGQVVTIGSRVKHYGQRWTGRATATVVGFKDVGHASPDHDGDMRLPHWIKVLVEHNDPGTGYNNPNGWDWDRVEAIEPLPFPAKGLGPITPAINEGAA